MEFGSLDLQEENNSFQWPRNVVDQARNRLFFFLNDCKIAQPQWFYRPFHQEEQRQRETMSHDLTRLVMTVALPGAFSIQPEFYFSAHLHLRVTQPRCPSWVRTVTKQAVRTMDSLPFGFTWYTQGQLSAWITSQQGWL